MLNTKNVRFKLQKATTSPRMLDLMYLPALLLFAVFVFFPITQGIKWSFTNWNGYSDQYSWVGFDQYTRMFNDSKTWLTIKNTLIYGLGSAILQNLLGLAYALALNGIARSKHIARTIVYFPAIIAPLIMGYVWYFMFQYNGGALNDILILMGAEPLDWLANGPRAVWLMTMINTYQYMGVAMVIYLAGLQGIPQDLSSKWMPPTYLYLENFTNVWEKANLGRALFNTAAITVLVVILVVLVGAFAAYPLARYPTRRNNFVYLLSISILVVPALTILVPLYKFVVDMGGINTYWAITLIHTTFALPLSIFMFTGFIRTIPKELDEAALIDGCSRFSIFFRVIMPLLKPVTASIVIFVGLSTWNDYTFSLFFLQRAQMQTTTVVLSQFFSQYSNNAAWVAAGSLISMIPKQRPQKTACRSSTSCSNCPGCPGLSTCGYTITATIWASTTTGRGSANRMPKQSPADVRGKHSAVM